MMQSRGRPALGAGKSLKMTVLVEQDMLDALEGVMQEMRGTMPGVRIDRSTAVRHVLSKALAPYVRTIEAPVTPGEDHIEDHPPMGEDHFDQKAATTQDHKRTTGRTGRKRHAAAKG